MYDELVESGAVETWHDVKASLGLDKGQWSDREKIAGPPKVPGHWDASGGASPYSDPPPRTAAQVQMDREMAAMMREKLIDRVTPWVIGLIGLYILGYLIKLVIRYVRWKTARHSERGIARARRHASRRTRTRSSTRTRTRSSTRSGTRTRSKRTRAPSSSPSGSKEKT